MSLLSTSVLFIGTPGEWQAGDKILGGLSQDLLDLDPGGGPR